MIQRKGEVADSTVYFGKSFAAVGRTTLMDSVLGGGDKAKTAIAISQPSEFRQVSAIIDVDIVPETACPKGLFTYDIREIVRFLVPCHTHPTYQLCFWGTAPPSLSHVGFHM